LVDAKFCHGCNSRELQAQINSLLATLSALQAQLGALQGGSTGGTVTGCSITSFDVNLKQGDSGAAVKCLQVVLNSAADTQVAASGVGSSGNETEYFGPLTKAAVIKFQEKYASEVLASYGLTQGTGFVGVTTRAKLNSMLGTGGTGGTTPVIPSGSVSATLAADTYMGGGVAQGAQDVLFTKVAFYGGTTGVTITKIAVMRSGVSDDNDLSDVKIYDGTTQLGSTQALSTLTHKATFSSLSWNIPAGTTKYLTIKGSIDASNAGAGNGIILGIASAADISSDVAVAGNYPINGNEKRVATASVGQLDVDKQTTPATSTILSGATDQEIASWKFDASQGATNEAFDVHMIKITHVGSASRDDITNIKLKYAGQQIGPTVASLDASNAATFDLSGSPVNIPSGSSKIITAVADVASGIWTSRTIIFEITQYSDVVAYGGNSGGIVTVTYNDSTTYVKQTGNTMTIGQGTMTVAADAGLNPAAQTYVKGTTNRTMTAIKFSAGSTEGVRVTKLVLTQDGTNAAATDIANITLWDGTVQIAGPSSQIGSTVTFGSNTVGYDATGLFDLEAGKTKTILVKADVPNGADADHYVSLDVAAATDVYADGLASKYDVPSGSISGTCEGADHDIGTSGSIAVSLSATSPVAQTYVVGATTKEFTRINLTAGSGEDISVTSITLDILSNGSVATSGAHLTNVKLVNADTGVQYGTTVAAPTATASFSGNLIVPAAGTVTLKAIADIPTTSYPVPNAAVKIASGVTGGTTIANALTSTGVSSGVDITETGSAAGNTITVSSGTLTIATAPSPGDQTRIVGTSGVPIVGLILTAGTAEDARITSIKFTMSAVAALEEASTTDLSSIAIYDGDTRLTSLKPLVASTETTPNVSDNRATHHTVQFTASDFLNYQGIDITKGQQKVVTVKGDLPSTATNGHVFALGVSSTDDVTAIGLLSNAEISETLNDSPAATATGVNFDTDGACDDASVNEITIADQGTVTIAANAGRPVTAIMAVGEEGVVSGPVEMHKVDFTAALEDIYIKDVTVERATASGGSSRDEDFGLVSLWDGSTQLGYGQYLSNGSTTFSFPEGNYWLLTKGTTKTLTIKAEFYGVPASTGYGSRTGDAPLLRIDTVSEQGVSSGQTDIDTIATADLSAGNHMYLRQSKPTLAAASLPSTTLTTGEKVFYRWTVTADAKGAIGWKAIAFNFSGTLDNSDPIGAASTTLYDASGDDSYANGIYVVKSGEDTGITKVINNFKVWDLTNNVQVTATGTDAVGYDISASIGAVIRWDTDTGVVNVIFIPASEEVVAAGQTKTYELRGTILAAGTPATGDSVLVRIADPSTSATTNNFDTVVSTADTSLSGDEATTTVSFVWTDRSGATSGSAHSVTTADWTQDYKVSGIPTATLSLTK
jgi:hypothetical protein